MIGPPIVLVSGVLGLLVGSFLNVVIHRVPLRRSVAWPASRCPVCDGPIRPPDNLPLLSYALLGGRCRDCGGRIPVRYPAVEAATGALYAAAVHEFRPGVNLLAALVFVSALVALAVIDLERGLLPNVIVLPAGAAGFALSALGDPAGWWAYPASAAAAGGGLLAIAVLYQGGMGMGDVKMGAMLGTFLGPYAALAIFLAAVLGSLSGGLLMALGKAGRRQPIPFGTFMAAGGIVTLFFGPQLWGEYLDLLGGH